MKKKIKSKIKRRKKLDINAETLTVNGIEYVKKGSVQSEKINGEYKIVRCHGAGVFLAIVESRNLKEAVLRNARRLWYWAGAASLSQLAVDGTSTPSNCKFPAIVDKIEVTDVIEVISVTEKAKKSLDAVKVWQA